jgi:ligand-binding sensor domain-containing protein
MKPFLFLVFLLTIISGFSQNCIILDTSNSALPENNIWSLTIDKSGNKWFGTGEKGLVKYDGNEFTIFDKTNSPIIGNYISPLFVDSKNNIWVSTALPSLLLKYNGENWEIFSEKDLLSVDISVLAITEDYKGNIYFGGMSGVSVYNGEKWDRINFPFEGIIIRSIAVDTAGNIAIGHEEGLLLRKDGQWKTFKASNNKLQNSVESVLFLKSGELFIGYGAAAHGGFSIYLNGVWNHFNVENNKMPDNTVKKILLDDDGTLWMITFDGLVRYKDGKTETYKLANVYRNVYIDMAIEDKTIWIATFFGVIRYDYK